MEFEKAKEKMDAIKIVAAIKQLEEPFDPELIYWKPQAVKGDKAIGAAYADPRAYSDRLNEVMTPAGWSVKYSVVTMQPIPGTPKNEDDWKNKHYFKGKVLVIAELYLHGIGMNSGTGESDAGDENAMTSAEAQAFKRAATRFGLGRYLYDLPKNVWCAYNKQTKRIEDPPALPEWALPRKVCEDCSNLVEAFPHGDRVISISELIANSQRKYSKQLCAGCQKVRAEAKKKA